MTNNQIASAENFATKPFANDGRGPGLKNQWCIQRWTVRRMNGPSVGLNWKILRSGCLRDLKGSPAQLQWLREAQPNGVKLPYRRPANVSASTNL